MFTSAVLGWMTLVHAAIGMGEAIITGVVVRFVLLTRPDLIHDLDDPLGLGRGGAIGAGRCRARDGARRGDFLAPFAWDSPDGLEHVASQLRVPERECPGVARGAVPRLQADRDRGQQYPDRHRRSGRVGTIAVFAVGSILARSFAGRKPKGIGPDVP